MKQTTFSEIQPSLIDQIKAIAREASKLPLEEKINFLNEARAELHEISPFKFEPIDYVKWVPATSLTANDWNPNQMAQNEVNMLDFSMIKYGMSQAIVGFDQSKNDDLIIDGWHRNWRGSTNPTLKKRMYGYLPVTYIRGNEADQIEATDLFNKTKGKHAVIKEAKLVTRLVDNGRNYEEISKNLGKSCEEIIRLQQVAVAPILATKHYARAWVAVDGNTDNSHS
ncbi:MAG: hypothetical protein PHQ11_13985 [Paludibacter sp.]|nr:hypothetical protein [Paludibacter sp.]